MISFGVMVMASSNPDPRSLQKEHNYRVVIGSRVRACLLLCHTCRAHSRYFYVGWLPPRSSREEEDCDLRRPTHKAQGKHTESNITSRRTHPTHNLITPIRRGNRFCGEGKIVPCFCTDAREPDELATVHSMCIAHCF